MIEYANCRDCTIKPLRPIVGQGDPEGLFFVLEAPKMAEFKERRPASGSTYEIVSSIAKSADMPFFVTNLVACRTPAERTPDEISIACCGLRLQKEIERANPKLVVFMGAAGAKILGEKSVQAARGKTFEFFGFPAICTFAPGMTTFNPNAYYDIEQDVLSFFESKELDEPQYRFLSTREEVSEVLERWISEGPARTALDIETSDTDFVSGRMLLIGMGRLGEPIIQFEPSCLDVEIFERLQKICGGWVVANGTFEYCWFRSEFGIRLEFSFDTYLAHHALDERGGDAVLGVERNLKALAARYLNAPNYGVGNEKLFEAARDGLENMRAEDFHSYLMYNAWDVYCTLLLAEKFDEMMRKDDVYDAFENVTMKSLSSVAEMEFEGIYVDRYRLEEVDADISVQIENLKNRLQSIAGSKLFNPNSPKQVAELLFDAWGMPDIKNRSTDKDVVAELNRLYPNEFFDAYLEYKALTKLQGTYTRGLKKHIRLDGKIHTRILLYGTETGRLSSRSPNLQNIPNPEKSVLGNTIRSFFIPPEGCSWVKVDYSQLELRIAAFLSQDENLIRYFLRGGDMHREVASILFKKDPKDVTKLERTRAKTAVFGIIYGMSEHGAKDKLNMTLEEAKDLIDRIAEMFPRLTEWADEQVESGMKNGFVRSYYGRKRRFPVLPKDKKALSHLQRTMVNTPVQCLASDICLLAMDKIMKRHFENPDEHAKPVLIVHDEIDMIVRDDRVEEEVREVRKIMESVLDSNVPIKTEAEVGRSWGTVE